MFWDQLTDGHVYRLWLQASQELLPESDAFKVHKHPPGDLEAIPRHHLVAERRRLVNHKTLLGVAMCEVPTPSRVSHRTAPSCGERVNYGASGLVCVCVCVCMCVCLYVCVCVYICVCVSVCV